MTEILFFVQVMRGHWGLPFSLHCSGHFARFLYIQSKGLQILADMYSHFACVAAVQKVGNTSPPFAASMLVNT